MSRARYVPPFLHTSPQADDGAPSSPHDRYQSGLASTAPSGVRIAHPKPCHPACANGCRECDRLQEGAEYEPAPKRLDGDGRALAKIAALGGLVVVAVLLGLHIWARLA